MTVYIRFARLQCTHQTRQNINQIEHMEESGYFSKGVVHLVGRVTSILNMNISHDM